MVVVFRMTWFTRKGRQAGRDHDIEYGQQKKNRSQAVVAGKLIRRYDGQTASQPVQGSMSRR